jgi:hypothetical protein
MVLMIIGRPTSGGHDANASEPLGREDDDCSGFKRPIIGRRHRSTNVALFL